MQALVDDIWGPSEVHPSNLTGWLLSPWTTIPTSLQLRWFAFFVYDLLFALLLWVNANGPIQPGFDQHRLGSLELAMHVCVFAKAGGQVRVCAEPSPLHLLYHTLTVSLTLTVSRKGFVCRSPFTSLPLAL